MNNEIQLTTMLLFCGSIGVLVALSIFAVQRQLRFQRALEARREKLRVDEGLVGFTDTAPLKYYHVTINGVNSDSGRAVIAVTNGRLLAMQRRETLSLLFSFPHDQLRWFGRPQKYTDGINEIWLHYETENGWKLLKLWMHRAVMQDVVRALKTISPPELVTAYRRRRPYIHAEPITAHPAAQDIHGAWTLAEPVMLYLMPRFLLILDGETVLRKIPLEAVQQIGALRRLDQPGAQGLLRFHAEEETFAFALDQHEAFANAVADAAKRTLEAPMERKQKGKDDYEDEDE
ncbi:MAG: hypothetical protein K8L97_24540 [Anaerolineae bacterium]|nr:hypothetical protein [Anaerolineae bacterium]